MRRLFAAVMLALPLSGCIDAELTLDFKDKTTVEFASKTVASGELVAMSGASAETFCQGKPAKPQGEGLMCEESRTMTIEALQAELGKQDGDNPLAELQNAIKVERLDDKTALVTLDFSANTAGSNQEAQMMAQMFAEQAADNKIVLNVKAPKIVETTGTLSEDGKTARLEVPVLDLMTGKNPPAFVTKVELESCTFFIFC